MSSDEDSKVIRISLDVRIPYQVQGVQVSTPNIDVPCDASAAERVAGEDQLSEGTVEIQKIVRPAPRERWPVKVLSGDSGVTCAWGNDNAVPGNPNKVKGHCYTGGPDTYPPPAATEAPIGSGTWMLPSIPGAVAGAMNSLKIWYFRDEVLLLGELQPFMGIASDETFCDATGSAGDLTAAAFIPSRVYIPTTITVSLQGFSAQLGDFNGNWTLAIVPHGGDQKSAVWKLANPTGDAQIELVANLAESSAELRLVRRATEISYRVAAGGWNPTNVCEFSDVSSRAVPPDATIPAIVQVEPGVAGR